MRRGSLAAIILAAGYSSRMGDFKPLLRLGGERVITRAVRGFYAAGITGVRVVVGHRAADLGSVLSSLGVTTVVNENYAAGMFSSVQRGVNTLAPDTAAFFLLPGDMPLVRPTTIEKLARTCRATAHSVLYPCFRGRRGHPPLVTRDCFGAVRAAPADCSLRTVLEGFAHAAGEVACVDQGILLDLDTPADYERALVLAGRGPVPTPAECEALFELYAVPGRVRRHGRKVAEVAGILARALNQRGFSLDLALVRAGGLWHDIAKGHPHHALKGGEIVRAEGFPPVAEIVRQHTDLSLAGEPPIDERTLVYLADKLVQGESLVPCAERFRGPMEKFGHRPEVAANIKRRRDHAFVIKSRVKEHLGLRDLLGYVAGKMA